MEFKDWINLKYAKWRGDSRATVTAFAAWLGIKQSLMTHWLNGKMTPRDPANIAKLARRFGNEIYGVLGYYIPPGKSIAYWYTVGTLDKDQIHEIYVAAETETAAISDPTERHAAFERLLKEKGVDIYKVELVFPLIDQEDPDLQDIIEIYQQMTTDEKIEFVEWGKDKLLEKSLLQSKPKTNHSQSPA